ncbi:hypothetical protein CEXT_21991 [Caerostris extrusa]|uniref:Uncharacterized protein n=1 Tax=Caerostris extrusa TaxID=172846 RepID=A0AAV4MJI7_CAEEX|nr:hypothetical protein CEXT_21991 [Caerostris extrusa]
MLKPFARTEDMIKTFVDSTSSNTHFRESDGVTKSLEDSSPPVAPNSFEGFNGIIESLDNSSTSATPKPFEDSSFFTPTSFEDSMA